VEHASSVFIAVSEDAEKVITASEVLGRSKRHSSVLEEGEIVPSNGRFYPSGFYGHIQVHRLDGFIHTLDDENNSMSWDCYPITDLWSSHLALLILDLRLVPRSARFDSIGRLSGP
jgi:hypothetical protein